MQNLLQDQQDLTDTRPARLMFADDISLFLFRKNIDTLFASMIVELENVST